ncbi:sensor histidine kinase [Hymenobacter chitinivorans]|uniref:Histidine kinase n=1 Tax=Hymenobacter chitinivorans DSM 11115 TaxID=1121954 RepID=A0A2M9BQH8_9BACT|nr:histidine kinase [Hymenobacter chitinivorans]PJJ60177.1 histidine kinase [Hymenobacter chitinivorans DSM 11115]
MTEFLVRLARRWSALSSRTTALLLQVVLWLLLGGFYLLWNNRPNYYFAGPVWPLVLVQLSFAVVLFNSLVYLIIPRWLLRGRTGPALAGGLALIYGYRIWMYLGARLSEAYVALDPVLRRTLHGFYIDHLWADLTSLSGMLASFMGMLAPMLFPLIISFLAYALVVDRRRLALERDHLRLERSYLKAQINPQFLFTTLGSLRTFTHSGDERAGDVVLHLADLMRYTLYETDAERVPLDRELEFLDDYLALERLRNPASVAIHHEVSGMAAGPQTIAPLVLHPFVERLFAGLDTAPGPVTLHCQLLVGPQVLALTLTRTTAQSWPEPYASAATLQAARRRLALQYPGHTLALTETDLRVHLHLTIPLD